MLRWAQQTDNGQACLPDFDAEFSASFPNLWAFMTWTEVGEMMKDPGKVTVSVDGSAWKLAYYDPAARRGTSVVAKTLMDGFRALDAAVVHPDTVWTGGKRRPGWTRKKK